MAGKKLPTMDEVQRRLGRVTKALAGLVKALRRFDHKQVMGALDDVREASARANKALEALRPVSPKIKAEPIQGKRQPFEPGTKVRIQDRFALLYPDIPSGFLVTRGEAGEDRSEVYCELPKFFPKRVRQIPRAHLIEYKE